MKQRCGGKWHKPFLPSTRWITASPQNEGVDARPTIHGNA
jgi:hypothetical protein